MATAAVAIGAVDRPAALPVTVRLTDETFAAVAGTVTCAWSSPGEVCASTVPRAHEEVPLPLSQP